MSTIYLISLHILSRPANEVWGKVMFSEACISHSVHRATRGDVQGGVVDSPPLHQRHSTWAILV